MFGNGQKHLTISVAQSVSLEGSSTTAWFKKKNLQLYIYIILLPDGSTTTLTKKKRTKPKNLVRVNMD